MRLASGRNRRKKGSLHRPNRAMASHVSAPPMTAQVATNRTSVRAWSLFSVSRRGSGRPANTAGRGRAGIRASSVTSHGVARNPYDVTDSKCARPAVHPEWGERDGRRYGQDLVGGPADADDGRGAD